MTPGIRCALIAVAGTAMGLTACSSTISGNGSTVPGATRVSTAPTPSVSSPSPTTSTASGGGRSSPAATALEQATKAAVVSASAFRMTGTGSDGSELTAFDIHYGKSSSRGRLTVGGQHVELLNSGPDLYMKASSEFWKLSAGAPDSVVNLLADKWAHLPTDSPGLSELADIGIRERFVERALSTPDTDTYSTGPAKTISGVSAVSFVSNEDETTVYVPAKGTPYPIRIEDHGSSPGSFDLTEWNVPFTAAPPPSDQIVELPH